MRVRTMAARGAVALAVVAATMVPATAVHAACYAPISGNQPEYAWIDVNSGCFGEVYTGMTNLGYRPVYMDVFTNASGQISTNTIWRPGDGTPWALLWGLDYQGYLQSSTTYSAFRVLSQDSYVAGTAVNYAVIYTQESGAAQVDQVKMSAATYQNQATYWYGSGYRQVVQSAVVVNGVTEYSAVWEQVDVGAYTAHTGTTASAFGALVTSEENAGRSLAHVDVRTTPSGPVYSSIWYGAHSGTDDVAYGLTRSQLDSRMGSNAYVSRYLRAVSGYVENGVLKFAALWRHRPDTTVTSGPSSSTNTTGATLRWASTEAIATYQCRIDSGAWTACASPKSYGGLGNGYHLFEVKARDRQGLLEWSQPDVYSWVVDTTPPNGSITKPLANHLYVADVDRGTAPRTTVVGSVTVTATGYDQSTGIEEIEFSVDGSSVSSSQVSTDGTTWWFTWLPLPGQHTLTAYVWDGAGNFTTVNRDVLAV